MIKRVVEAARECDLVVASIVVGADGSIRTLPHKTSASDGANDNAFDQWLADQKE